MRSRPAARLAKTGARRRARRSRRSTPSRRRSTLAFDDGSLRERELFADCVVSTESKALRHLFFAEREAAKVPDVPKDTPAVDIQRAAVVGAGTMGGGIAMSYANAGIPVLLKEVDDAALQRGLATIRKNYESTVAKGKMTAEALERTMALITPTTSYDGFDQVDIVVEAVFENMDLKKATFAELGRVTRPDCVLASNTSTLDIDEFAQSSGRPAQVIGHHFFSPANVMKLLEIVRGRETSKRGDRHVGEARQAPRARCRSSSATASASSPTACSPTTCARRTCCSRRARASPQIDRVLTDFGMPVGPFGMQDIAGIDVGARIRQYLRVDRQDARRGPAVGGARPAVRDGPLRAEDRRGLVPVRGRQPQAASPIRWSTRSRPRKPRKRGITRRAVADDEILARITTALANEGARVLEDGFALRAGDIDVIYCYGFGFPRHRGGPMFYADTVGLPTVLARVQGVPRAVRRLLAAGAAAREAGRRGARALRAGEKVPA